jgi:cystathionine beta-lyase/cystathionine gamma-synthase
MEGFETRAVHAGQEPDTATGAIMTPVYLSSTFVQQAPGKHKGYEYSRTGNPTRTALERNIASLEGAKFGLAYSSGMAAIANIITLLKNGDHVICCNDVYGGTYRLFEKIIAPKVGIKFDFVELTDAANLKIRPNTKMIWLESPTNPLLKLIDINAVAGIAKKNNALLVVDNTFMTPYFQKPLSLGADIVIHSATKYLGGHSDVLSGLIVTDNQAVYDELKFLQNAIGAVPSPFDCFLVLRGIKTLALRMVQHEKNALLIAGFLERQPSVKRVIYPGLETHPQYSLAKTQMTGFGGMLSFEFKDGIDSIGFIKRLGLFSLAESLGGVESLIEYPAVMTHASVPKDVREKLGITDGLIRVSVGIETAEDLINDLRNAIG